MRRFTTIACFAAAAAVAAPIAAAGNGKPVARTACRPVSVAGKVASVDAASFGLDVLRAGRAAHLTVAVAPQTRVQLGVRRVAASALTAGQPVLVVGRACGTALTARLVLGKVDPAKTPITTGDSDLDGPGSAAPAPPPANAPAAPASPDEATIQ
jgi:hypothetical protein